VMIAVACAFWNSRIGAAMLCYIVFLALSGLVFLSTLSIVNNGPTGIGAEAAVGAYVIAWLIGLLTPGLPAGLGVRESVLVILLTSYVGAPVILLTAIAGRAITVLGDLIFFGIGHFLRKI